MKAWAKSVSSSGWYWSYDARLNSCRVIFVDDNKPPIYGDGLNIGGQDADAYILQNNILVSGPIEPPPLT